MLPCICGCVGVFFFLLLFCCFFVPEVIVVHRKKNATKVSQSLRVIFFRGMLTWIQKGCTTCNKILPETNDQNQLKLSAHLFLLSLRHQNRYFCQRIGKYPGQQQKKIYIPDERPSSDFSPCFALC